MPWTAEVRLYSNGEEEDRANATLIWDEGGSDEFAYHKPVSEVSVAAAQEMLAEAIAARGVAVARRAKETQLTQALENIANA